jgi:putative ubiquitin-RnfH superfamily antitoxin RatB of RatAB toxin-antitoxin module
LKVFFTYQGVEERFFYQYNVSSSLTVEELLQFNQIKEVISKLDHEIVIAVNSKLLDGNFKPLPHKYRLKEGERVELLRPLSQNPKERRLKKV